MSWDALECDAVALIFLWAFMLLALLFYDLKERVHVQHVMVLLQWVTWYLTFTVFWIRECSLFKSGQGGGS